MPPDYSGQNLRGRSFKGQNLTGANFSGQDIRGANFTNAILKHADFTGAKAGLQKRWVIGLVIVSWLLSAISGFFFFFICALVTLALYTTNLQDLISNALFLILLVVFFIVSIQKGFLTGLGNVVSLLISVPITIAVVLIGAFAFAFTIAGAFALVIAIAIVVVVTFLSFKGISIPLDSINSFSGILSLALLIPFPLIIVSAYIGWRSLAGNEQYAWVRSFAIAFAATGGTSFRNADLTDADFTGATLKNTDFRKANLTRTRFYEAKKLDFARVDDTILTKLAVIKLLVTGNGRGKSYAGVNLKGANLIDADLKEANLRDANITEATFQGACLEGANLTLAQAVGTNFTSAQMTGAVVEAWNIESTTKLDNVDCRFIYLLENPKPETDDRERRPNSGDFQPGEFTKLFEEVLNTVDLIFRNGIDWKAFVNAFQTVQDQNEDTELALQSIENKGDGVVVVKVGVPDGADKEKIHSDFTQNYQLALQAVEEKYKVQLQAKDEQIVIYRQQSGEMTEIVKLLANKPINVQVDNKVENKNMTNSNDASRKFENSGTLNNSGTINLGEISGTVTNTINQLPASPEPDKPGIKELLTQLQAAIEADTNLLQEDKAEALEQVKALAEAGKSPQEGAMQKAAKTAIKILKGTISSLPSATKLVEQCSNLLPLISTFLGLG
ncbi:pentapeptide repeat-containing protein [Nostoc sp.]|uniref:pentapeptide repeat-containing protein n=1 Tax=Nostoc sp. TaxID=1180 RepID=UPI002FF7CB6C